MERKEIPIITEEEQLILDNMHIAKIIARQFFYNPQVAYGIEDLEQEAYVALCKAAATYVENSKTQFSTYAYTVIMNHMRESTLRINRPYLKNDILSIEQVDSEFVSEPSYQTENVVINLVSVQELKRYLVKEQKNSAKKKTRQIGLRILQGIIEGKNKTEIMEELGIEPKQYKDCLYQVRKKLKSDFAN